RFYYRFVFDILNHQLLGGIESEKVKGFQKEAKRKNQIYINPSELEFSELHQLIFKIPLQVSEYGKYFKAILKRTYYYLRKMQPENKVLPELIISIFQAIEKLEIAIADVELVMGQTINPPIFFRLLGQYLNQVSVSYEGEPLKGLQVMGILETRCLDFKNVIIIGFNEGFWPRSSIAPSYIPHNLRFVFGLPSIDNQDAMYSYYFYRLIQRADTVNVTYNSVKEGLKSGELSRLGYQLIYDSKHKVNQKNLEFRFKSNQFKVLEAKSSKEVVKQLLNRYTHERPLSPSALNIYIGCKYRFYLRYVAGLPEADEITEEVDSRLFGNIFHKAVESLYTLAGNYVTTEWIDKILNEKHELEQSIRKAFAEEYFKTDNPKRINFEGNTRLSFEFIRSYIIQLLKVDRVIAPIEIVSLEKHFTIENEVSINGAIHNIPVGGIIDRLDRVGEILRVIDYKTGNVKSMTFSDVELLFDGKLKEQKKEAFQAMLYSLIIYKKNLAGEEIRPGIYALRKLFAENFNPYFKKGRKEIEFKDEVKHFEENINLLLNEIFSEDNIFSQTENTERCKLCPYKIICHRN
ncbi:MAG: PD-(D/E)XK nuclease family protein, partial [Mariniphaga sp.]|nr:PD-(D/E)XK nuclease family protein [Mariniphaga sp.]